MEVILLGTGGPRPDPRRMATTTLIRLGEENILIDAGRGVMVQLCKAGVPLGSINTVFLTHHHFDHIGDLYDVMLNSWLHGRKDDLRIYGPPDTERLVNTLVTQVYDKDIAWRDQGEPSFGGWKPVVATDIIPGPVLDTGAGRSAPNTSRMATASTCRRPSSRAGCVSAIASRPRARSSQFPATRCPAPVSSDWPKGPTCWSNAASSPRRRSTTSTCAGLRNSRSPAAIQWARSRQRRRQEARADPSPASHRRFHAERATCGRQAGLRGSCRARRGPHADRGLKTRDARKAVRPQADPTSTRNDNCSSVPGAMCIRPGLSVNSPSKPAGLA